MSEEPYILPEAKHFSVWVESDGDVHAKAKAFDGLVRLGVMNVKRNVLAPDGKSYDLHAGFARKMPERDI